MPSYVSYPCSKDFQTFLQICRQQTLTWVDNIHLDIFSTQSHPDFSPVGWHLGHIAYTESLWVAGHLTQLPHPFPQYEQYEQLFSADGLPKAQRQNLPQLEEILMYMATVREHTLNYLNNNALNNGALKESPSIEAIRLWHWLIQHESQHSEIIAIVLAMHQQQGRKTPLGMCAIEKASSTSLNAAPSTADLKTADLKTTEMVPIEAGDFCQGNNAPEAIDNERPVHNVWLARYWIDRTPVTCGQYRQFIEAGGYKTAKWWCKEGWQWQQQTQLTAPLYWTQEAAFEDHPVCGVSWYEADAYARFAGKRLPTESEWAKAAGTHVGCQQMLGNVWEWTDTWFAGYPGFQPFPYEGYSQIYFDGAHRVLRGGSWATSPWALRESFRNWYHPHRRELFAGFRCAA